MASRGPLVMPPASGVLAQMGEQIKLARLRRQVSAELVAERAGISRSTLRSIEKGSPSVSMGAYAAALHALGGMDRNLLLGQKMTSLAASFRPGPAAEKAGFRRVLI